MIDPFETFERYIAIKLTYDVRSSYDYFTYGGKTRQSKKSFLKRNDRHHFYALGKQHGFDIEEITDYLFMNMLYSPDAWIGDLLDESCKERHKAFLRYRNNFSYAFREEAKKLKNHIDNDNIPFESLFSTQNGQPPLLMQWVYAEMYTPMILLGFNRVLGLLWIWLQRKGVFQPLLVEPLERMSIFTTYTEKYAQGLTYSTARDSIRNIFLDES